MGSTRLPGKSIIDFWGSPLIVTLAKRLQFSRKIAGVVVATTDQTEDDVIEKLCLAEGISVFRGNELDLTERYYAAAKAHCIEWIIRATGDCPFLTVDSLDYFCDVAMGKRHDFSLVTTRGTFPRGIDYEYFSRRTLETLVHSPISSLEREHLTLALYNGSLPTSVFNVHAPLSWMELPELTLDCQADLNKLQEVAKLITRKDFCVEDIIRCYRSIRQN